MSIVGILPDDVDPLVSVMKVEKAPVESYADIGGLHDQVFYLFFIINSNIFLYYIFL
jgi:ATP-dependent 26S proteasome regulatory subunit